MGLFVADVSGHGAPAAIVMAMLRATLHLHPRPTDPAEVLRYMNEHFGYLWDTSMFATAVYGVLDVERRKLRLACAGHPVPLLLRRGASVSGVPIDAVLPLLLMELDAIPTTELQLQPGDRLLFYTDGVTDRTSRSGAMYDLSRLSESFARVGEQTAREIVAGLVKDVDRFSDGQEAEDDMTLLVLELAGTPERSAPGRGAVHEDER